MRGRNFEATSRVLALSGATDYALRCRQLMYYDPRSHESRAIYPETLEHSFRSMDSMDSRHQIQSINPPPVGAEHDNYGNSPSESRAIAKRDIISWEANKPQAEEERFLTEEIDSWKKIFRRTSLTHWLLLFLSCALMLTAFPASSILTRLYFVDGGTSKWIVSWLAPAGWPITAAFLLLFCLIEGEYPTSLTWELALAYAAIGFLSAADNLMFAYAYAYLPASSTALLSSSSLTFTAILAYFIVGQKFNSSTVNAVAFMTTAAVILGLDSNSDRPPGVSAREYATGFVLTILGSAVHGLIFALSELLFIKLLGRKSFREVLEVQTATSVFATIFTTIGVLITGDFQNVHREALSFRHGPSAYYLVFTSLAVTFQLGILGSVGCLYCASTLLAGVLNAARVPVTAIVAVICFNDPMGSFKILAIVLTVWSFGSWIWGSYQQQKTLELKNILPDLPISSASERL